MLQEALLRGAVKFEYDSVLRSEVAVALIDHTGKEVQDLREWLPLNIYGEEEYRRRVQEIRRRRYYGLDASDKAGILRYTKVKRELFSLADIPLPENERELTWLLSEFWNLDQPYNSLTEMNDHLSEGTSPAPEEVRALEQVIIEAGTSILESNPQGTRILESLGFNG